MKFPDAFKRWLLKQIDPTVGRMFMPTLWTSALWGLLKPDDPTSLVENYKSWVYICANLNARTVATVPLRLYVAKRTGQKLIMPTKQIDKQTKDRLYANAGLINILSKAQDVEEVVAHPYLDLMKNVNPYMNQFDLSELTQLFQETTGDGYWYLPKNSMGMPVQIWIAQAHKMEIVPDRNDFISHYLYNNGFNKIRLEKEDVIHFKMPSLTDPYYGMGPLAAISEAYNTEKSEKAYLTALYKNMGRPDYFLKIGKYMNKADKKDFMERWNEAYGGTGKAGKVALLEGEMDAQSLSFKPAEMISLDSRKYTMNEIANAFGVPISKLTQDANRANSEIGITAYQTDTIAPRLRRNEEKLNEQLMPRYDPSLFVAYDNNIPEDREFKLKERGENIKSGFSTRNEERAKEGIDPLPGGDTVYIPFNLVPLGSDLGGDMPGDNGGKSFDPLQMALEAVEKRLTARWRRREEDRRFLEPKYYALMLQLFKEMERQVLKKLEKFKAIKGRKLPTVVDLQSILLSEKEMVELFQKKFKGVNLAAINLAVERLIEEVGAIGFEMPSARAIAEMIRRRNPMYAEITKTTNGQLTNLIKDSIERDLTIDDLAANIKSKFGEMSTGRANVIARTETINMNNGGEWLGMKESGKVQKKMWLTQRDADVREEHAGMDGEIVKVNVPFSNGLDYPQEPNCRCAGIPVLEE